MSSDDDALSWAGDEDLDDDRAGESTDPRRPTGRRTGPAARRSVDGVSAVDDGARSSSVDAGDPAAAQVGSIALVVLGLLGGVHVLYAAGWTASLAGLHATFAPTDVVGGAMFSLGLVLAAASPVLWLASSLVLTRTRSSWHRVAALVVGALVLVPWPFVLGAR